MPPQHIDPSLLMQELQEHNDFFDNLVDMIPAKLYVGNNPADEQAISGSKYQKTQSKESKAAKKSQLKVERGNKFDPSQQESTRDLKRRLEQEEAENNNSDDEDEDEDEDDISMNGINFQDDEHEEEEQDETDERLVKEKKGGSESKNSAHQSRIEELRAKLRAKLEERRSASTTNSASDAVISKRAARRAEKRRRLELAKKKQAEQNTSAGKTLTGKSTAPNIKIINNLGGSKINSDVKQQSNFMDDLSGIDFGGIAGLKDDLLTKGKYTSVNKSLKNMGKKKNLEKLLQEAEAKKERLRQLKESDNIEDKEKAKKIEWNEALKIAK